MRALDQEHAPRRPPIATHFAFVSVQSSGAGSRLLNNIVTTMGFEWIENPGLDRVRTVESAPTMSPLVAVSSEREINMKRNRE